MNWSFALGRIAGTDVRVHATFFLLILWIATAAWIDGGPTAAAANVVFVAALFACVVAHEFGHILMARRFGIATPDVTLLPIGGIARIERMPERPGQEIAVALAGPAVNVAIWGAVMLALAPDDPAGRLGAIEDPTGGFWARLAGVNLFLALFNLIPAFPMDGGRVLRALLQVPLGRVRATRLAARAGQVFAFAFGLAGLLGGSPVLVLIAVFVFIAAGAESQDVELRDMARTARAADAMVSRFEALAERDALGAAAQAVIRTTQHEFPVLDPAGRIAGFLTRGAIIEALAGRTHPADVGAAMARAIPEMPPDAPLIAVIEALGRSRAPAVAIVAGGRLAGYVTAENLGEMLLLRGAGGPLPRPDQRQAREHP